MVHTRSRTANKNKRKDPPPSTSDEEEEEEDERLDWRMDAEESHSDWTVEIRVAGKKRHRQYHVHKTFLSVGHKGSEYFARLFASGNFAESDEQTSRIELEELAAEAFPVLLDYLYACDDDLKITHENSVALHFLGGYFEIRSLRKKVRKFWKTSMNAVDQHGMYLEHAKLFHDEKAYRALVEKSCGLLSWIDVDSKLMEVFDAQFWLDVSEDHKRYPSDKSSTSELSFLLSAFCSNNKDHLDAEMFLKLTEESALPEIARMAAISLMELEQEFVPASDDSTTELSNLQERCIAALVTSWENVDHSADQKALARLGPLVLSNVLTGTMEIAKQELKSTRDNMRESVGKMNRLESFLPQNVVVQGAAWAINGIFEFTGYYCFGAPRFAMEGMGGSSVDLYMNIEGNHSMACTFHS